MKKLLLLACSMLAAVGVYAQGTVTFINNASTLVTYDPSVPGVGGTAVPTTFRVALYYSPTAGGSLTQIGASAPITPIPGRFNGGVYTTPTTTPGGGTAWFQVRAWSAGFNTYEDALASGSASTFAGASTVWSQVTGNASPSDGPKSILPPTGAFAGINNVAPVPEPSSIALGLLGLGAVALFRRRK